MARKRSTRRKSVCWKHSSSAATPRACPVPAESEHALDSFIGACPFRRTSVHPRIKSGGRLSPGHALLGRGPRARAVGAGNGAEGDVEAIGAVDGDDREREVDEILLAEL